jgi:hypothetical protein
MASDAFDQVVAQAQEYARSGHFGDSQASVEEDEELKRAALVEFGEDCTFLCLLAASRRSEADSLVRTRCQAIMPVTRFCRPVVLFSRRRHSF